MVITKVSQEFFSATTFVENDFNLSSDFSQKRKPLTQDLLSHYSFQVVQNSVKFENLMFYSDQLINSFEEFTIY